MVRTSGLRVDGSEFASPAFPDDLGRALRALRGPGLLITRNNLRLHRELSAEFPDIAWQLLTKEAMRGWGMRRILAALRQRVWTVVLIEDTAPEMRRRANLYAVLLLLARARTRWLLGSGESMFESRVLYPGKEWPRLVSVLAQEAWASIRAIVDGYRLLRQSSRGGPRNAGPSRGNGNIAMLRTQFWFQIIAGGSVSHVRGVASGMRALGLVPRLWTSSKLPGSKLEFEQTEIPPEPRPSLSKTRPWLHSIEP